MTFGLLFLGGLAAVFLVAATACLSYLGAAVLLRGENPSLRWLGVLVVGGWGATTAGYALASVGLFRLSVALVGLAALLAAAYRYERRTGVARRAWMADRR